MYMLNEVFEWVGPKGSQKRGGWPCFHLFSLSPSITQAKHLGQWSRKYGQVIPEASAAGYSGSSFKLPPFFFTLFLKYFRQVVHFINPVVDFPEVTSPPLTSWSEFVRINYRVVYFKLLGGEATSAKNSTIRIASSWVILHTRVHKVAFSNLWNA